MQRQVFLIRGVDFEEMLEKRPHVVWPNFLASNTQTMIHLYPVDIFSMDDNWYVIKTTNQTLLNHYMAKADERETVYIKKDAWNNQVEESELLASLQSFESQE